MSMTLKATSREDLLAAVPVVLGFAPEESLVMLTFGAREQFHARIDLPPDREHVDDCVDAVLRPAVVHGVGAVVFVQYAAEEMLSRQLAQRLAVRFGDAGIRVIESLRVHGGRWFAAIPRADVPRHGVAYDVDDHAFRASAVYDGRVTLPSRADVAARVRADPRLVAETERALDDAVPLNLAGVVGLVSRCLTRGRIADPDDLASLLLALRDPVVRDQAWSGLRREDAAAHVTVWADIVRRCPDRLVGPPAAILALVAWLSGDGALSWCALDRCFAADETNPLGRLVAQALTEAVPPSRWTDSAAPTTSGEGGGEVVASGG
ncbi:DUF4192 domain-containing protein [Nocardioides sp. DS6]|uniref:DUF4192 domain-containing protein n=1 Tax=Nocardioides eburneus TaxID=3231482 RepID=A0ABV3T2Y9_9ACTN